jgi:hypothetical protein
MEESPALVIFEPVANVTVVPTASLPPLPELNADQLALSKLLTDLVKKKPETRAEAIELFHTVQAQLSMWLVSALPGADQKAILSGLWAANELNSVVSSGCFGFLKK